MVIICVGKYFKQGSRKFFNSEQHKTIMSRRTFDKTYLICRRESPFPEKQWQHAAGPSSDLQSDYWATSKLKATNFFVCILPINVRLITFIISLAIYGDWFCLTPS
jgi:hypothetical protein